MKNQEQGEKEDTILCRHSLDPAIVDRLIQILSELPARAPSLVRDAKLPTTDFDLYFNAAIQSIRGTTAASTTEKQRFLGGILDIMREAGAVKTWEFVGTKGRQDYRVRLPSGRLVCIEAKGCPDGNNMNIWERPTWAEEFIVWSQCPESLAKQPGEAVWSGIAIRLLTKVAVEGSVVDAFVFYDPRCGSEHRRCWKDFGLNGARGKLTNIPGQDGRDWLPPPSVYLFPRTAPHPRTNRRPPLHSLDTCQFAKALLLAFKVPKNQWPKYTHWASIELRQDERENYKRVAVGHELGKDPVVVGRWIKLKRE